MKRILLLIALLLATVLLFAACEESRISELEAKIAELEKSTTESGGTTEQTPPNPPKSLTSSVGLEFESNGDGTCYVVDMGTCTDTDIVIPSKSPNGDTVIGIEYGAFED